MSNTYLLLSVIRKRHGVSKAFLVRPHKNSAKPKRLDATHACALSHLCSHHIDFLNKEGGCRREQLVFLPDQDTPCGFFRAQRNKFQIGAASYSQRSIQTERTAQSFFHQQHGVGQKGLAQGNIEILLLPANPVQDILPDFIPQGQNQWVRRDLIRCNEFFIGQWMILPQQNSPRFFL